MSKLPKTLQGLRGIGLKGNFTNEGVRLPAAVDDYDRFASLDGDLGGSYARGMEGLHNNNVSNGFKP